MSHMLDWQMFGDDAGGHHMVSVLIHGTSTALLFLALFWMTGSFWPSAMVAAIFGLHPLRVESVAWAAERKDVLSGLFWISTMLAYAWYAQRPHILRYLVMFAAVALAMMSKSMAVTLPCALILLDYWPLRRLRMLSPYESAAKQPAPRFPQQNIDLLVVEKIPLFALAVVVCKVTTFSQQAAGALNSLEGLPLGYRFANALVSYIAYLGKMIFPWNLTIFYPHAGMIYKEHINPTMVWPKIVAAFGLKLPDVPGIYPSLIWPAIAAGIALVVITAVVLWLGWRRPYITVGWFWYVGTLIPVIGLVQVGIQAMADRYTYLPSIGITLLVVWGACELLGRSRYGLWTLRIAGPVVVLVCLGLTTRQVGYWKDSVTLFNQSIRAVPDSYFGYNHLGKELDKQALEIEKDAAAAELAGKPKNEVAKMREQRDKLWHSAEDQFKASIEINPDYDFGNNNLGVIYARFRDIPNAMKYFIQAVHINKDYADAHNNLCSLYAGQNKFNEAVFHGERAVAISPEKAPSHVNLGMALEGQKRLQDAANQYNLAIQLDPGNVPAYLRLGMLSMKMDNSAQAAACFEVLV
jgi:tetratricopeptide (TPR) repeat protein